MEFDKLSNRVIGCALKVHRALGPGLLESAYEQCLAHELAKAGIPFKLQHPMPIDYDGVQIDCGYRADVLVEDRLLVELKSVQELLPIHEAQLLTYADIHEARGRAHRVAHQLQRPQVKGGHQAICVVGPFVGFVFFVVRCST